MSVETAARLSSSRAIWSATRLENRAPTGPADVGREGPERNPASVRERHRVKPSRARSLIAIEPIAFNGEREGDSHHVPQHDVVATSRATPPDMTSSPPV